MRLRLAAALVALAAAGPVPAATEGPEDALAAAGVRVASAVAGLEAAGGDEAAVSALAEAMAGQEAALAAMRDAVFGADERERALAFELQRRRTETASLAIALQTFGRKPPPASMLHPEGPLGAARAGAMLKVLAPALQSEADALAARLKAIEAARRLRAKDVEALAAGLADQARARAALSAALARRPADAVGGETLEPAALREIDSLSALADRLAGPGGGVAPGEAPLPLRWPVEGRVLRGFAEPDAAGMRRPGLLLEAAPLALVTAPADARVRYAGPFLDYGYVVVLEPRADALIVLAGIAALETGSGAEVRAGALLGFLGGRQLDTQEYLMLGEAGTGETPAETLYIELRQGQGPVDPSPWFGDRNE